MAVEIERKFEVIDSSWQADIIEGDPITQGYVALEAEREVRVRATKGVGYLTIKGAQTGASRPEFEYEISIADANELIDRHCDGRVIDKTRYKVPCHPGLIWEVDVYSGLNAGLVTAEVELPHENFELKLPDWIGQELTADKRYKNKSLAVNPFTNW